MLVQDKNNNDHASRIILGDAQFCYYPLWSVKQDEIFCYLCEAFWEIGGNRPMIEDELTAEFDDPGRILALDLETLHKALGQANEVAEQYGSLNVLVPVHFETLAHIETAKTYARECNKLVWPIIDNVYFEIIKLPELVQSDKLVQAAEIIKAFSQGVMLRVDPGFDQFDKVPAGVFYSVGLDLRVDPRPEDDITSELIDFAAKAKQFGLCAHVHGLESVTLSAAAIASGFDFIGSDAIATPLEEREHEEDEPQSLRLLKTMLNSKKEN